MRKRKEILPADLKAPPRVRSLVGMRFGRLVVRYYAGRDKQRRSLWCCLCDCGSVIRVPGRRLLGTKGNNNQKSCGCYRADPGIRAAARLKVPAARRKEICDKMRRAVRNRVPAYSMDIHRAAEILGVSLERMRILCQDGKVSAVLRGGIWRVSSGDVADIAAEQERKKRRCTILERYRGANREAKI